MNMQRENSTVRKDTFAPMALRWPPNFRAHQERTATTPAGARLKSVCLRHQVTTAKVLGTRSRLVNARLDTIVLLGLQRQPRSATPLIVPPEVPVDQERSVPRGLRCRCLVVKVIIALTHPEWFQAVAPRATTAFRELPPISRPSSLNRET